MIIDVTKKMAEEFTAIEGENVPLIENELLQIMKVFNYTKLTIIFTPLIHFTKRFEPVNESDKCFY